MYYSYNFTFDDETNIASLTAMEVTDGVLKTATGYSSGIMITSPQQKLNDITEAVLLVNGTNITEATYWVSNDGGSNYEIITPFVKHTFTSIGKIITLKVQLNSDISEIDSISLMFK